MDNVVELGFCRAFVSGLGIFDPKGANPTKKFSQVEHIIVIWVPFIQRFQKFVEFSLGNRRVALFNLVLIVIKLSYSQDKGEFFVTLCFIESFEEESEYIQSEITNTAVV